MSTGIEIEGEGEITLTRTIAANVSDVFAAWTDPALIEQWQTDEAEFDAFEGGHYHFVTYADEDEDADHEVSGDVLQFVEDERLVLSWVYKDEEDELIFVLDIVFKAIGEDATTITLTERGLAHADAQTRIFSMEAWSGALEELAELME
ncbi:SRPBCC family protein [Devosia chinhatensis]|uniref:Activator of Hsp90 ATPase homologue 1/2-like C-terminal domain-containing protein n=1 Tax=Devosia chinhatensis TaxID=429727 RepID=A0A0F5FKE0_9HYPH|nr:SRPBCC domain-containing protein [Devosia chinhatensis]KKB09364.1 hypothetical protein VE26_05325 [Devosia chinhatensis]